MQKMSFTVSDFHDLVEILHAQPAWREELRSLVLTEDILGLPQAVRELVEISKQNQPRAALLAKATQLVVIPVVAGESILESACEEAVRLGVETHIRP